VPPAYPRACDADPPSPARDDHIGSRGQPVREAPVPVSVMIFTLNEEIHLPGCLEALCWCDDVIVVDSFSTDGTESVCREYGVRFFQHLFEGFGSQRNWALAHSEPKHAWILILDADERVPPALALELAEVAQVDPPGVGAYRVRRRFHMWGRWLRHSSLYPTWVVRFIRKDRVRYLNRGHAETQQVAGELRDLGNDLIDENRKGIDEWFERQNRYSRKDAEYELGQSAGPLQLRDLLAGDPLVRRAAMKRLAWRMPGRPLLFFLYSYLWRGGFRDGKDGFMFCYMKALYCAMVQIKKFDAKRGVRSCLFPDTPCEQSTRKERFESSGEE
jgi:glycosyltransferase involved in cell wall biosynthesis